MTPRFWRLTAAATSAACLLLAIGGTAGAAASTLDLANPMQLDLDPDTHFFQGAVEGPTTVGGYQYVATWHGAEADTGPVYLEIIRRRLSDDNVVTLRFDGSGGTTPYSLVRKYDGHNYVGLGLSVSDGRIHLSWAQHGGANTSLRRHHYLQSTPGCLALPQEQFDQTHCNFTFQHSQVAGEGEIGQPEYSMTYPKYFTDNQDRLYFAWRYDASERGNRHLNVYNGDGTWTPRGAVLRGRNTGGPNDFTYDPDGPGPAGSITSHVRGVYTFGWVFDSTDRLHVAWFWREPSWYPHGIFYAYSDDYGVTWNGLDGPMATSGSDPITIKDLEATRVAAAPPGYYPVDGGLELDSENNPHIISGVMDQQTNDPLTGNSRQKHYWRSSDGVWHEQFIEPPHGAGNSEGFDPRGDGVAGPGSIFFDEDDNAYALFSRNHVRWVPYNSDIYVQSQLPTRNVTWQPRVEGDGYLNVQLYSSVTCIDNIGFVNATVSPSGANRIRIRMRNQTSATGLTVWWTNESTPSWSSNLRQVFTDVLTPNDTEYRDYELHVTDPDWTGTLRGLEICTADGVSTGRQRIDSIRITDAAGAAAQAWEFDRPMRLYLAEASAADDWATWTIRPALSWDSALVYDEGYYRIDRTRWAEEKLVNFVTVLQGEPGVEHEVLHEFGLVAPDPDPDPDPNPDPDPGPPAGPAPPGPGANPPGSGPSVPPVGERPTVLADGRVSCPANGPACSVTATWRAAHPVRVRGRKRLPVVARRDLAVPAGSTARVQPVLSLAGRRLRSQRRSLRVHRTITVATAGEPVVSVRTIILELKKPGWSRLKPCGRGEVCF